MGNSIWKNSDNTDNNILYEKLYENVDEFFSKLEGSKVLEYREGQHTMALDIVDTIKDKQILLVEAEVGIGKSYAYLIPILNFAKENNNFKGCIIATSTIALQEQLLNDVKKASEMLGIDDINVVLAKGKNNYICRKRLEEFLINKDNERYRYILDEISESDSYDRNDFDNVSERIWREINVRNCIQYSCPHYANCKYVMQREDFSNNKQVIITNQALLAQHLKTDVDDRIFSDVDMIIIDEAHNLEENVRNAYKDTIDKRKIEGAMYHLYSSVALYDEDFIPDSSFFESLNDFFTKLRSSAKTIMKKNELEVTSYIDHSRVAFNSGPALNNSINSLITSIHNSIAVAQNKNKQNKMESLNKQALTTLDNFVNLLQDILKSNQSQNIYWVDFLDYNGKYVQLSYAPKKINELTASMFSKVDSGIALTSATLTTGNSQYDYFSDSIGLDKVVGKSILKEFSLESPYDYENNALLYCPRDISNPKNKDKYLQDLVEKIKELLELTEGKSLILFTSKNDMNYVYNEMKKYNFDFPLYVQSDGASTKHLKQKFENEVNSCLFATGSFYEGIDIKGESLSSVIIARLPFPIVDPVIEAKSNIYKDGFQEVYLPEMLLKLKQGVGRLIRSGTDKGIVSILDSRFLDYDEKYQNTLTASLPFTNVTDDIEEVKKFVGSKLR